MKLNSLPSGCRASHGKILRTEREALIDLIPELFFIAYNGRGFMQLNFYQ